MPPSSEQITGFLQSIQRLLVLIAQKKAQCIVHKDHPQRRYSGLLASLRGHERHSWAHGEVSRILR